MCGRSSLEFDWINLKFSNADSTPESTVTTGATAVAVRRSTTPMAPSAGGSA